MNPNRKRKRAAHRRSVAGEARRAQTQRVHRYLKEHPVVAIVALGAIAMFSFWHLLREAPGTSPAPPAPPA